MLTHTTTESCQNLASHHSTKMPTSPLKVPHVPLFPSETWRPLIITISLHDTWAEKMQHLTQPHCPVKCGAFTADCWRNPSTMECMWTSIICRERKKMSNFRNHYVRALGNARQGVLLKKNFLQKFCRFTSVHGMIMVKYEFQLFLAKVKHTTKMHQQWTQG